MASGGQGGRTAVKDPRKETDRDEALAFAKEGNVAHHCRGRAYYPRCCREVELGNFVGARLFIVGHVVPTDEAHTSSRVVDPLSFYLVGMEALKCR